MQIKSNATVSTSPLLILSAICMIGFFMLLASMFASTLVSSISSGDLFSRMMSY